MLRLLILCGSSSTPKNRKSYSESVLLAAGVGSGTAANGSGKGTKGRGPLGATNAVRISVQPPVSMTLKHYHFLGRDTDEALEGLKTLQTLVSRAICKSSPKMKQPECTRHTGEGSICYLKRMPGCYRDTGKATGNYCIVIGYIWGAM